MCIRDRSPIDWGGWETTWTGRSSTLGPQTRMDVETTVLSRQVQKMGPFVGPRRGGIPITTTTNFLERRDVFRNETTVTTRNQTREGIQFRVGERFDTTSLGDKVVNTEVVATMRSRNICLLYTSPSPRDRQKSRMPSSA